MEKSKFKRIVIKIGSSCLTHENRKLNYTAIQQYIRQLVDLKNIGKEILLVSSGAIGAGMGELKLDLPKNMAEKQGMAAVGQGLLISLYNKILRQFGEVGGQILLTAKDIEKEHRSKNIYNTLEILINNGIIPIINENDTVATEEIKFGDNDTLSAKVARLIKADLLIILTDVEGLYNKIPCDTEQDIELINKVKEITVDIEQSAGCNGSIVGTGGMKTKLEAAKIVNEDGITMVIGPAYKENIVSKIIKMLDQDLEYNIGTTFLPKEITCRKEVLNNYKEGEDR
ncbi:MAG: glutamate 5-kinase [Halanaerobiales bacterium]|nr:glutamate 5-kinase [Halanaerobiales bacterium]